MSMGFNKGMSDPLVTPKPPTLHSKAIAHLRALGEIRVSRTQIGVLGLFLNKGMSCFFFRCFAIKSLGLLKVLFLQLFIIQSINFVLKPVCLFV